MASTNTRRRISADSNRSACPVARALDILGDRWTLLVVRDLLKGKKRYGEFMESGEKIPTNVLSDRLRLLNSIGLVNKILYSEHPPRWEYYLTDSGRELGDIVKAMRKFGTKHLLPEK
jgi:DNA-binding HxlR family transcriptional regulator